MLSVEEIYSLLSKDLDVELILTYFINTPSLREELEKKQFEGADQVLFDLSAAWLFHLNKQLTKELNELEKNPDPIRLKNFHVFFKLSDTLKENIRKKIREFSEKIPENESLDTLKSKISSPVLKVIEASVVNPSSFMDVSNKFRKNQDNPETKLFVEGSGDSSFFDEAYKVYKKAYLKYDFQQTMLDSIEKLNLDVFLKE
ncbi:MAG: hypothetical protein JSS53_00580, partial [Proteobacteria bacterium]|nr:hypothetical protein [Pseudomonadota bacterium]